MTVHSSTSERIITRGPLFGISKGLLNTQPSNQGKRLGAKEIFTPLGDVVPIPNDQFLRVLASFISWINNLGRQDFLNWSGDHLLTL